MTMTVTTTYPMTFQAHELSKGDVIEYHGKQYACLPALNNNETIGFVQVDKLTQMVRLSRHSRVRKIGTYK